MQNQEASQRREVNRYLRNAKLRSKSMERGRTVTLKLQNQEASQ